MSAQWAVLVVEVAGYQWAQPSVHDRASFAARWHVVVPLIGGGSAAKCRRSLRLGRLRCREVRRDLACKHCLQRLGLYRIGQQP